MKKLLLAVLMTAMMAAPALASVQNVKISGNINNTYITRTNFADLGANTMGDEVGSLFLIQTNLEISADLTDNVSATVSLINERAWDEASSSTNEIDLNLAYVELREMLYSPLTVVIGRQSFSYGNCLVFSTANRGGGASELPSWVGDLSGQYALDAARAILDYDPLKIEMFFGRYDANPTNNTETGYTGNKDIWGVDATYSLGDDMDTVVEAYFFAQFDKNARYVDTAEPWAKKDKIYVPGMRVSTNPIEGLNLQLEYAHQAGTEANGSATNLNPSRNANAIQLMANYEIPAMKDYNPTLAYAYTYVSGDKDAGGDTKAWDPFWEDQGYQGIGKIYNSLFTLSNLQIHELTFAANPMEDVTTTLGVAALWTAKKMASSSSTFGNSWATNTGKKTVGQEIDLSVAYDYTEDVQIGANFGYFMPGSLFTQANENSASQASVNVNVAF